MPIPEFHTRMSQGSTGSPLIAALRRLRQLDSAAQLRCGFALGTNESDGTDPGGSAGWAVWEQMPAPSGNG